MQIFLGGGVPARNRRVPLTPLTEAERDFAGQMSYMVSSYIRYQKLDDDWYDVACMGFLQAVKLWFVRKDLHHLAFQTVAFRAMKRSIYNERKKQERRIQTISLDEEIPGADGLTLLDTITADNRELIYLGGDEMNITYNTYVPERPKTTRKSDEILAVENFLTMKKNNNMCLEYDTEEQAMKKTKVLAAYRRTHNHANIYDVFRVENRIYVVKTK